MPCAPGPGASARCGRVRRCRRRPRRCRRTPLRRRPSRCPGTGGRCCRRAPRSRRRGGSRGRRRCPRRSASGGPPPGAHRGRRAFRGPPRHAPSSGRLRGRRSVDRMPTDPPATLAAWLRTRSDEQLSALLVARPDVARPAPSDVVALASRLAVPVSVDRALDELDAATLQLLDVVLLAPTDGVTPEALFAALPDLPDDVLRASLDRLTGRALLWGDDVLRAPDP